MSMKWDQSKFDRTFGRYMDHTSRDLVSAINTKAYYVARKATWFTHKADRGKMRTALGQRVTIEHTLKKTKGIDYERIRHKKVLQLTQARDHDAPLAGLIVNKRRGKKGQKGLQGREMGRAVRDLLTAREKSIAYTKSGWLPAIKRLAVLADKKGQPAIDTQAKTVGKAKGEAMPAMSLHSKSAASIINEAWATHDEGSKAFYRYGSSGLQRAFNDEAASMTTYLKDKMKPAENKFNAAQKA